MEGIPPARPSDNEDVIWALETAESLWKRNARVDAIVWLRRAAQEAADAGDDDRAAGLMVEAAALTDEMARASAHLRAAVPTSRPPLPEAEDVDDLLATVSEQTEEVEAFRESGVPTTRGNAPTPTPPPRLDLPTPDPAAGHDLPTPVPARRRDLPTPVPPPRRDVPTPVPPGSEPTDDSGAEPLTIRRIPIAPEVSVEDDKSEPAGDVEGVTRLGPDALSVMDLAGAQALAGSSEEQREQLVETATVVLCASEVLVPSFGFALVLEGEVTANVAHDDAVVCRFGEGAVIRVIAAAGDTTGVRFLATMDDTTVALWSEAALERALLGAPAIEARLRADGDRLRAWARVTASPLAARLHEDVRLRIAGRLTARVLAPAAELVLAGEAVPGVLLVGGGTITVDGARPTVLQPGEFVFPDATLTAARASATARAGQDGAIVLCADRHTTQELCATEPFLIELLAAGG